jgi:hypothetical protein
MAIPDCQNIEIALSKLGPGGIKLNSRIANISQTHSLPSCCGVQYVFNGESLWIHCDKKNTSVLTV